MQPQISTVSQLFLIILWMANSKSTTTITGWNIKLFCKQISFICENNVMLKTCGRMVVMKQSKNLMYTILIFKTTNDK